MTQREKMLKFWNEEDPQKARWLIVDANNWEKDIEPHLELILAKDPVVKDYVCSLNSEEKRTVALEVGCGIGRLMRPMTEFFDQVIGLDISKTMQEQGRDYLGQLYKTDRAKIELLDETHKFNVSDNSVDFVYSLIVFQHIPSLKTIDDYLAESFRVMKSGAVMRVQTHRGLPNPDGEFHGFAGYMFRNVNLFADRFRKAGFKVVSTQDGLGHPEWLWVTAKKD